jgi:hypothetical protein
MNRVIAGSDVAGVTLAEKLATDACFESRSSPMRPCRLQCQLRGGESVRVYVADGSRAGLREHDLDAVYRPVERRSSAARIRASQDRRAPDKSANHCPRLPWPQRGAAPPPAIQQLEGQSAGTQRGSRRNRLTSAVAVQGRASHEPAPQDEATEGRDARRGTCRSPRGCPPTRLGPWMNDRAAAKPTT